MTKAELDKDIEKLFAASENISGKVYTSMQKMKEKMRKYDLVAPCGAYCGGGGQV